MARFRFGFVVVLVAVVASVVAVSAFAKKPPGLGSPAITFTSPTEADTLTSASVDVLFTYNRAPHQTQTLTCELAGPTPSSGPCDAPVAAANKASDSGVSYSDLANGDYTLTVALVFSDGGTTSATLHFTVNAPLCASGSENFSEDALGSQPATFGGSSGGTIDTAYGTGLFPGRILEEACSGTDIFCGAFTPGAHVLYSGGWVQKFTLTFTQAVSSVALDASSSGNDQTVESLTAYDAGGNSLGTVSGPRTATFPPTHLSVTSTTNNIKYFEVHTSDLLGVAFTNIVWGCAS